MIMLAFCYKINIYLGLLKVLAKQDHGSSAGITNYGPVEYLVLCQRVHGLVMQGLAVRMPTRK